MQEDTMVIAIVEQPQRLCSREFRRSFLLVEWRRAYPEVRCGPVHHPTLLLDVWDPPYRWKGAHIVSRKGRYER